MHCLYRPFATLLGCFFVVSGLSAATYHVDDLSTNGDGSGISPFNSIQAAANAANAGDTVIIHGGTYRETITPPRSGNPTAPIIYRVATGETAVINGTDLITGWTQHSGMIYRAPLTSTRTDNQLFFDGKMMPEARWPNASAVFDPFSPIWAKLDAGNWTKEFPTTNEFTCTKAGMPDANKLVGARIHIAGGYGWVTQTGPLRSAVDADTFKIELQKQWHVIYGPTAENKFYLYGHLNLLDTGGEWFHDSATHVLYFQSPGGGPPASGKVEIRVRDYGFDLSGRSHIQLEGLQFFACGVKTDDASAHLTLDKLNLSFISHQLYNLDTSPWESGTTTGLLLKGTKHRLTDSTLTYSSGNAIRLEGSGHAITGNTISKVNYSITDCWAIDVTGSGHLISRNRLSQASRGLIHIKGTHTQYLHNELSHAMTQCDDGGAMYVYKHDGEGSVIANNIIHDIRSGTGGWQGNGIYLDNHSRNFTVKNNLVYDADCAMRINPRGAGEKNVPATAQNNIVVNNTLIGKWRGLVIGDDPGSDMSGTRVVNNILIATHNHSGYQAGKLAALPQMQNNFIRQGDAATQPNGAEKVGFRDYDRRDFHLAPSSPVIDTGLIFPPYTDGYSGRAPDAGALEHRKPASPAVSPIPTAANPR